MASVKRRRKRAVRVPLQRSGAAPCARSAQTRNAQPSSVAKAARVTVRCTPPTFVMSPCRNQPRLIVERSAPVLIALCSLANGVLVMQHKSSWYSLIDRFAIALRSPDGNRAL
jgi:hypothetical protein